MTPTGTDAFIPLKLAAAELGVSYPTIISIDHHHRITMEATT